MKVIPSGDSDLQKYALEAEGQRLAATMSRDFATLNELISKKLIYIHSSGEIATKSEYMSNLAVTQSRYASIKTGNHHVTSLGSAVILTYEMYVSAETHTGRKIIEAWATAIWKRTGSSLRLELFQSTKIPVVH